MEDFVFIGSKKGDFVKLDGSKESKTFMNQKDGESQYYKGDGFIKASKHFKNGMSISFSLPNNGKNIFDLVKDEKILKDMLSAQERLSGDISWRIPRFKTKSEMDLIPTLEALGVKDIFDSSISNFTKMTDFDRTFVSGIKQINALELDEKGGKAASMTQIDVKTESAAPKMDIIEMHLDRPFLYSLNIIMENGESLPIMVGIVGNPEEIE